MKSKKYLSLLMIMVMLFTMAGSISLSTEQLETFRDGNFEFNSAGVLTKYDGHDYHLAVPNTLTSGSTITITSIGESAFEKENMSLRGLYLPETITRIGAKAFNNCKYLGDGSEGNLLLPKNINQIDSQAFANTAIKSVTFTGDAPILAPDAFGDQSANPEFKLYYTRGSKGYGATLGGYPCFERKYKITCPDSLSHGTITTTESALEGEVVKLNIQPEPGYSVGDIYYRNEYSKADNVKVIGDSFVMPANNVSISTSFGYAIKTNPMLNGSIKTFEPVSSEGEPVVVFNYPDQGFKIKEGSLKYSFNGQNVAISKNRFIMPKGDVTISGEFEPSSYKWNKENGDFGNQTSLVCTDSLGNLYALVQKNKDVRVTNLEFHKRVNGVWSKTEILGTRIDQVINMCADSSGRVYMINRSQDLYVYTPGQEMLQKVDFKNEGLGAAADITGIAVDSQENIYVTDCISKSILKKEKDSNTWKVIEVTNIIDESGYILLYIDKDGTIYICPANDNNNKIYKKLPTDSKWEIVDCKNAQTVFGLSVSDNGTLYALDTYSAVIHKLEKGATAWSAIDMGGYAKLPIGMAVDKKGKIAIVGTDLSSKETLGDIYTLEMNYNVTFDANGGVGNSSKNVAEGALLGALPAPPTKNGFTFDGWNTNQSGTGILVTENMLISNDTVFYAKWKAIATGGGSGSGGGGGAASTPTPTTPKPLIPVPTPAPTPAPVVTTPPKVVAPPAPANPPAPKEQEPVKAKLDQKGVASAAVGAKELKDELAEAKKSKEKELDIKVDAPKGAKAVETKLGKDVLTATKTNGLKGLNLDTPLGDVSFNDKALKALQDKVKGEVSVTVETKLVNGKTMYALRVMSGGKAVTGLGGNVEVSVPYTLKAGETAKNFKFYVADAKGKPVLAKGAVYNPKTKEVTFKMK